MEKPKTTIAELEAILNSDEAAPPVHISPDGRVLIGGEAQTIPWASPPPEMLTDPDFEKVWRCIKEWDIHVPGAYSGYCGATGNHVFAILTALRDG